jgi:hypothetical protein
MAKTEPGDGTTGQPTERRPYVAPLVESEHVIEKQLLATCYTADEDCASEPPQS